MTIIQELEQKYNTLCQKLGDKYAVIELLENDVDALHGEIKETRAAYVEACKARPAPEGK